MKRKLTNRERILLIAFSVFLIAAALYYGLILPQLNLLSSLEAEARRYDGELRSMKMKADPNNPLYTEYAELEQRTTAILKNYYPDILQDKLLLLLNEKLGKSGVAMTAMTFTEPVLVNLNEPIKKEASEISELEELAAQLYKQQLNLVQKGPEAPQAEKNELRLRKMSAAITIQGTYSQIYGFLKAIEQENRSILCSTLNIDRTEEGQLTCDLTLDFYSIPKPILQDEEYFDWTIKGTYGKENPF